MVRIPPRPPLVSSSAVNCAECGRYILRAQGGSHSFGCSLFLFSWNISYYSLNSSNIVAFRSFCLPVCCRLPGKGGSPAPLLCTGGRSNLCRTRAAKLKLTEVLVLSVLFFESARWDCSRKSTACDTLMAHSWRFEENGSSFLGRNKHFSPLLKKSTFCNGKKINLE